VKALIIGDSQSRGIGRVLAKVLRRRGWQVTEAGRSGHSTAQTLKKARKLQNRGTYTRVYVFSGGNNPREGQGNQAAQLVSLFPAGSVAWIGPPPATKIGNLHTARKAFGKKVTHADYWRTSGFAAKRESINAALKQAVSSIAAWHDVRDLFPDGVPPQTDGIHVRGKSAQRIASHLATDPFSGHGGDSGFVWAVVGVGAILAWRNRKTS